MQITFKVNFGGLFGKTEKQTIPENCFSVILGGKFKKLSENKQN